MSEYSVFWLAVVLFITWLALNFVWSFMMDYLDQRNTGGSIKQSLLVAWSKL